MASSADSKRRQQKRDPMLCLMRGQGERGGAWQAQRFAALSNAAFNCIRKKKFHSPSPHLVLRHQKAELPQKDGSSGDEKESYYMRAPRARRSPASSARARSFLREPISRLTLAQSMPRAQRIGSAFARRRCQSQGERSAGNKSFLRRGADSLARSSWPLARELVALWEKRVCLVVCAEDKRRGPQNGVEFVDRRAEFDAAVATSALETGVSLDGHFTDVFAFFSRCPLSHRSQAHARAMTTAEAPPGCRGIGAGSGRISRRPLMVKTQRLLRCGVKQGAQALARST